MILLSWFLAIISIPFIMFSAIINSIVLYLFLKKLFEFKVLQLNRDELQLFFLSNIVTILIISAFIWSLPDGALSVLFS